MNKLFTAVGEDWTRLWYSYRCNGRKQLIEGYDGYRDEQVILSELDRCETLGNYFIGIINEFNNAYGKANPYVSGNKRYVNANQVIGDALTLYMIEVGTPNKYLVPYLKSKRKLLKCINYAKNVHILDAIGYYDVQGFLYLADADVLPYSKEKCLTYSYPIYRLDGALEVIRWVKALIDGGHNLDCIKYSQYHGDSYPGETEYRKYVNRAQITSINSYREEMCRNRTLMLA
jgi:hypothetical protein